MPDYQRTYEVPYSKCRIVQTVIEKIIMRASQGNEKYGCTLEEQVMSPLQALREALEEYIDADQYLNKSMIQGMKDYDPNLYLRLSSLSDKTGQMILELLEIIHEITDKGTVFDALQQGNKING